MAVEAIVAQHRLVDNLSSACVLLVAAQGGGVDVELVGRCELPDAGNQRVALESVFRHEPACLFLVYFERQFAPPYAPVVAVAVGGAVGMAPAVERRGGDVGSLQRVAIADGSSQDACRTGVAGGAGIAEDGVHGFLQSGALLGSPVELALPAPVFPSVLDLVVAAPEDHAGVAGDTAYLLTSLAVDIIQHLLVVGIWCAGEYEVLPNHESE